MIQRNKENSSLESRELIVSKNIMNVTLDLFEASLIAEIRRRIERPMKITLTNNKKSVISVNENGKLLKVRLSRIFTLADNDVVSGLADFISGKARPLPARVRHFIDSQPASPNSGKRPPVKIVTAGAHYDLRIIARKLNRRYFNGQLPAVRLTWGRAPARKARRRPSRSIQYGSYDGGLDLIRIHPALDSLYVPVEFIESVVYHEMLHKKLGIIKTINGRRRLHTPEFRQLEREYEGFEKARDWEKKNFHQLLMAPENKLPTKKT